MDDIEKQLDTLNQTISENDINIAVICLPGENCKDEISNSITKVGMHPNVFNYTNTRVDLSKYDGYIITGGASQDDVEISDDSIMHYIRFEATKGKPVLGISTGAEILIKTGILPGLIDKVNFTSLKINNIVKTHKYTWKHITKSCNRDTAFTNLIGTSEVLQLITHNKEGHFEINEQETLKQLNENDQIVFNYNSSKIAALCNREGNVLAITHNPARSNWEPNVTINGNKIFNEPGHGQKIFTSMKKYIDENKTWD